MILLVAGDSLDDVEWFERERPRYLELTNSVHELIEEALRIAGINAIVESRTKTIESFSKKVDGLDYSPRKMKDLSGIRVICHLRSDCEKVETLLRARFKVYKYKSTNKGKELGIDRVGYNSIHLVASLKKKDASSSQRHTLVDLIFEIQIRTILQHAWAEIEHSRGYKITKYVPRKIRRRLNLIAGTLELLDNEFENISAQIGQYQEEVRSSSRSGRLKGMGIDSISLDQYLEDVFGGLPIAHDYGGSSVEKVIEQLDRLGISTLANLDRIVPTDFGKLFSKVNSVTPLKANFNTALMHILVINFKLEFFHKVWKRRNRASYVPSSFISLWKEFGINPDDFYEYVTDIQTRPRLTRVGVPDSEQDRTRP